MSKTVMEIIRSIKTNTEEFRADLDNIDDQNLDRHIEDTESTRDEADAWLEALRAEKQLREIRKAATT